MDFLLKQRLIGAVVLVALAVIFIPLLLEGPGKELVPEMEPLPELTGQHTRIELSRFPDTGEVPEEADVTVLQVDTAQPDIAQPNDLPPPEPDQVEPPETEPLPTPPPVQLKTDVKPMPEPAKSTRLLGNWVVQVGSFSSEQNALRLRDKLRKAGFVAQVEKVRVKEKSLFRVRVGPYLERSEADLDQAKLAKQLNLNGRVFSYP